MKEHPVACGIVEIAQVVWLARIPDKLIVGLPVELVRLEFVHESGAEVMQVTEAFMEALNGRILFYSLTGKLRQIALQGTTEGSFFVPDEYLTLTVIG